MAPDVRGTAVSMFASCFFLGQSAGVAAAAGLMVRAGGEPVFAIAAVVLLALGFVFSRLLARRAAG